MFKEKKLFQNCPGKPKYISWSNPREAGMQVQALAVWPHFIPWGKSVEP